MLARITGALAAAARQLAVQAPSVASAQGKAYEAWVTFELALRLRQRGITVQARDHRGGIVSGEFRISGAPSRMPSAQSTANEPCHFHLISTTRRLEIHVSLQFRGVSNALHELDISVLPAVLGETLRRRGGGPWPSPSSVVAGLELKALSANYNVTHQVPRALLGIALDLDPAWAIKWVTFELAGGGTTGLFRSGRTDYSLITTSRLFTGSKLLLSQFGVRVQEDFLPGSNFTILDDIVDVLT